ncbi:MAG: cyanophycinase [Gammaproteobacteria bacterium]|nr:cyanophycinase [Gammaproteobacteria bacterium]MBU2058962.1 cyanophycinase [Gammaproteobacteria bacterium]MBU2175049.1 cyanophycinase [Gammaproteobacteria bacterium]MBU2246732.1 cyanophycinase [Gammaproteobacteria bacterium]MBU2345918.1 cyanophycinase [Gammaproteobacteria bacterium]
MKKTYLLALSLSLGSPFLYAETQLAGELMIVGGALASSNQAVYKQFIQSAGGVAQARVVVIPAASSQPVKYFRQFQRDLALYGVPEQQVQLLPIAVKDDKSTAEDESLWRNNAAEATLATQVQQATAVWFLGGDQNHLVDSLRAEGKNSPVLDAVWQVYQRGGIIGGTSAGAAIMSEAMIASGSSWTALARAIAEPDTQVDEAADEPLQLRRGLGFFPEGVIDQHFDRRARFGRLIVAVAEQKSGSAIGYGVDEDSALFYQAKTRQFQALGSGGVTVIDLRQAKKVTNPLGFQMENIRLSYLQGGDKYDVQNQQLLPHPDKVTTTGAEYSHNPQPVMSGVFSANTRLKDFITFELTDNKAASKAISYLHQGNGLVFGLTFSKDEKTRGYWQYLDGLKDNSSAHQVRLDIVPGRMQIDLKPQS